MAHIQSTVAGGKHGRRNLLFAAIFSFSPFLSRAIAELPRPQWNLQGFPLQHI
jgi:hypothetical protein